MKSTLEKGKLLVSDPSLLQDMDFARSVILLTEHNAENSIGFIMNKLAPFLLSELIPEIEIPFFVFSGGPVDVQNVYFIHNRPDLIPDSTEIADGIFLGGDFNIVVDLINDSQLHYNHIRFFLGYSGWSPGQLEEEIRENSWIVVNNTSKSKIFTRSFQKLWKSEMLKLGKSKSEQEREKFIIWSNAPENPQDN